MCGRLWNDFNVPSCNAPFFIHPDPDLHFCHMAPTFPNCLFLERSARRAGRREGEPEEVEEEGLSGRAMFAEMTAAGAFLLDSAP